MTDLQATKPSQNPLAGRKQAFKVGFNFVCTEMLISPDVLLQACTFLPDKVVLELLNAFINALGREDGLREHFARRDARRLIRRAFRLFPSSLSQLSDENKLSIVCEMLTILGLEDLHRFPLAKLLPLPQLNIQHLSEFTALADSWQQTCDRLLADSFRGRPELTSLQRIGLLIVLLALRSGIVTRSEIKGTLLELRSRRIRSHSGLYWTSSCFERRRDERRRQWLTQEMVLLAGSIEWPGDDAVYSSHLIRDALIAIKRVEPVVFAKLNQGNLRHAGMSQGFFTAKLPVFVIEYMQLNIASSSLPEVTLARLMGRSALAFDLVEADTKESSDKRSVLKDPIEADGLAESPIQDRSPLARLSRLLSNNASDTKKLARMQIEASLKAAPPPPGLIGQILEWADKEIEKNKPRTVKMHLDNLHACLLPACPDLQMIDDPEVWQELLQQITAHRDEKSKAFNALSKFARFLTAEHGEVFVTAGQTASSAINAQLITVQEVEAAIQLLQKRLDPGRYKIARVMTELAYGCGLRRSEIDGLLVRDIELHSFAPTVCVRENDRRLLKTGNAKRNVPLELAEVLFPGFLRRLEEIVAGAGPASSLVFGQLGHIPLEVGSTLFNEITKSLKDVCGDDKVKFHSLRHSTCCNLLLALFFRIYDFARYESVIPHLKSIRQMILVVDALFKNSGSINRFELANVRNLMGHLGEATTLLHYQHLLDLFRMAGFTMTHSAVDQTALLGAAGVKQNSRAKGSRLTEANQKIAEALSSIAHELPAKIETKATQEAMGFQQTSDLREVLHLAMSLADQVFTGEEITIAKLGDWGYADKDTIVKAVNWIKATYLTGEFKREMEGCFERLEDQGSIDCLQVMLHSLQQRCEQDLRMVAEELCWLAGKRCRPYLSFRFDSEAEVSRAAALLDSLLGHLPLAVEATPQHKIGKKWVSKDVGVYPLLSDIPTETGYRYIIKLKRGQQRFPHRALTWLTIALRVCMESRVSA